MCSINHDMKAIFFHIPKNGGLYVENILNKYYGFKTYYFTRKDHHIFNRDNPSPDNGQGFICIKEQGMLRYIQTSDEFNEKMGMDSEKWSTYYKFTFMRNPYSRFYSGYEYIKKGINNNYGELKECFQSNMKNMTFDIDDFYNIDKIGFAYTHLCIPQTEHMLNSEDTIPFDFIGRFEHLNSDLVKVLQNLNISKIKHGIYLKYDTKVNTSTKRINYRNVFSDTLIQKINKHFSKDFELGGYDMYNNTESLNVCVNEENNRALFDKLKKNGLLEEIENEYFTGPMGNCIVINEKNIDKLLKLNNAHTRQIVKLRTTKK